ncbi:MAG: hypothetical protein SFY56_11205 [Bacteroidota bacterium]|nr:hypothetical protein [Bacteroidota bacterium]
MKRKQSIESDLYVINKKPIKKQIQELRDFIKEYKRKQALKKNKRKLA